jgi:hypothetical protein
MSSLARRPANGVSTSDGVKTKYTTPSAIWFSEPLDEEAFGYWGMHEVSLHGSQITSSRMAARVPARKCRVSSKTMLAGYVTPAD